MYNRIVGKRPTQPASSPSVVVGITEDCRFLLGVVTCWRVEGPCVESFIGEGEANSLGDPGIGEGVGALEVLEEPFVMLFDTERSALGDGEGDMRKLEFADSSFIFRLSEGLREIVDCEREGFASTERLWLLRRDGSARFAVMVGAITAFMATPYDSELIWLWSGSTCGERVQEEQRQGGLFYQGSSSFNGAGRQA